VCEKTETGLIFSPVLGCPSLSFLGYFPFSLLKGERERERASVCVCMRAAPLPCFAKYPSSPQCVSEIGFNSVFYNYRANARRLSLSLSLVWLMPLTLKNELFPPPSRPLPTHTRGTFPLVSTYLASQSFSFPKTFILIITCGGIGGVKGGRLCYPQSSPVFLFLLRNS